MAWLRLQNTATTTTTTTTAIIAYHKRLSWKKFIATFPHLAVHTP